MDTEVKDITQLPPGSYIEKHLLKDKHGVWYDVYTVGLKGFEPSFSHSCVLTAIQDYHAYLVKEKLFQVFEMEIRNLKNEKTTNPEIPKSLKQ